MYGIYEEANASSLIMSFAAVPADCKVNPKDEIFNPITSVMNDEMTVEEIRQLKPERIILSPGPGRPEDAGVIMEAAN